MLPVGRRHRVRHGLRPLALGLHQPAGSIISEFNVNDLINGTAQAASPAPGQAKKRSPEWTLTVLESRQITPRMQRVAFIFDGIKAFEYQPGQALAFLVPIGDGETGRRDYTIRSLDRSAGVMNVDFVLHGDAPGASWARTAKPGDTITVRGPRGRTVFNPDADWHLLCGDETCIPAILHILENMPKDTPAYAFIEIPDAEEQQPCQTAAQLELSYLTRTAAKAEADTTLFERVEAFALPPGAGQAYVIGETQKVRHLRHRLLERGMDKSRIVAEGYWRPGRLGGHDHIKD